MDFESLKLFVSEKIETGFPVHLKYHNKGHIEDVYQVAIHLARVEAVSENETRLLLSAVLYHDLGFLESDIGHEEISCRMAREDLPGFGFSPEDIARICGLILATRIPQNPHNQIERIICDADLDYLGRDDFRETGGKLFAEFQMRGLVSNLQEWNLEQIRFLESHRYFTTWSIANRAPKKAAHLEDLKAKLYGSNGSNG